MGIRQALMQFCFCFFVPCTWLLLNICQRIYWLSTRGEIGWEPVSRRSNHKLRLQWALRNRQFRSDRTGISALVRHFVRNEQMQTEHRRVRIKIRNCHIGCAQKSSLISTLWGIWGEPRKPGQRLTKHSCSSNNGTISQSQPLRKGMKNNTLVL